MYFLVVTVLGDSLHPEHPDLAGDGEELEVQQTMEASRQSAEKLHRIEFISRHDVNVICNFNLPHDQISTSPGQEFKDSLIKSKC